MWCGQLKRVFAHREQRNIAEAPEWIFYSLAFQTGRQAARARLA